MKKLIVVLLMLLIVVLLVACGNSDKTLDTAESVSTQSSDTTEVTESISTETLVEQNGNNETIELPIVP